MIAWEQEIEAVVQAWLDGLYDYEECAEQLRELSRLARQNTEKRHAAR